MQVDLQVKLSEVLENVLEQFAFMFCEPVEADQVAPPAGELLHASMTFSGPSTGRLDMAAVVKSGQVVTTCQMAHGLNVFEQFHVLTHTAVEFLALEWGVEEIVRPVLDEPGRQAAVTEHGNANDAKLIFGDVTSNALR